MSDNAQQVKPPKVDASGKNAEMTAMVLRADRSIGLERRPVPTLRDGVGVVIVVVWEGRIKNHLEAYWEDVPIEHITIDAVTNGHGRKKRLALRGES